MKSWNSFVNSLKTQFNELTFRNWISSLKIKKFDAANIYLEVLDLFHKSWVEEHIFPLASKSLVNSNGRPIRVHLDLPEHLKQVSLQEKVQDEQLFKMSSLDSLHSLESFVTAEENRLLLEILTNQLINGSQQLYTESNSKIGRGQGGSPHLKQAEPTLKQLNLNKLDDADGFEGGSCPTPAEPIFESRAVYNPIYIYGEKHSGKTHLLMALTQELLKRGKKAFFVHSETFMFHFVDALRKEKMEIFRESYRRVEVLLVDDIHLLRNKWATQEEFFHTFNALHNKGSQLIFAGNVPAPRFKEIEERLISRFEWGVSFKLSPLNPLQYPLLIKKVLPFMDLHLNEEATAWLSNNCNSPQELNEALHLLSLKSSSMSSDLESMKIQLAAIFDKRKKNSLTLESIVEEVAKYFKIKEGDFKRSNKERRFSLPRQIAFFLSRKLLRLSFQEIGNYFSRDHSTVIFNVRSIEKELEMQNEEISSALADIENSLKACFVKTGLQNVD